MIDLPDLRIYCIWRIQTGELVENSSRKGVNTGKKKKYGVNVLPRTFLCFSKIEIYFYYYLFSFLNLLLYDSIYNSNRCQVDDVACRTFYVGEVDRLVQTHLDRADRFGDAQCIQ